MKLTDNKIQELGEEIVTQLKTVYDPEIPVDIYELGLIYDVLTNPEGDVKVIMTLTTPNCPAAEIIPAEVEEKIKAIDGIENVSVEITFEPPWEKDMMSEEAKFELGIL